jgi:transposase
MNNKHIRILSHASKKEKDGDILRRIQMVLYTFKGETVREIEERMQCPHSLVIYWKKRYVSEGIEGLKTKQKSGKPKLISHRKEEKLRKLISIEDPKNPWTTKRICDLIKKETGIQYTQRHVQRILHRWNFNLLVPRPTFWQKASGEEIKNFWKKNPEIEERIS